MKDVVDGRIILCSLRIWVWPGKMSNLIQLVWEYTIISDHQRRIPKNMQRFVNLIEIIFTNLSFIFSYRFFITCSLCTHPFCLTDCLLSTYRCSKKTQWRMCMTCSLLQRCTCSVMIQKWLIAERYIMFADLCFPILRESAYFSWLIPRIADDYQMPYVAPSFYSYAFSPLKVSWQFLFTGSIITLLINLRLF